jgi:AcrR family transcriptional regulator
VATGDPAVPSKETETQQRILESAVRLFAERGYQATSVREITADAGCNVAAVNYHFGGKENLYLETFRELLADLRDRRIRRVEADTEASAGSQTLEMLLESIANAFLEPFVEGGRGQLLIGFMAHEMADRQLPPRVFVDEFIRPMFDAYVDGLERVGPPLEEASARMCIMSLMGQMLHVVKAHHLSKEIEDEDLLPRDLELLVRHVVRFTAGGIRACAMENGEPVRRSPIGRA